MKGILSNVLIFAAGAAVGSVVTWKLCKDRYAALAQEEIDSVKEKFSVKIEDEVKDEIEAEEEDEEEPERGQVVVGTRRRSYTKPDLQEYMNRINEYRAAIPKEEAEEEMDELDENLSGIYPIKSESFGDDEYDTEFLTLYADDVLADSRDFAIDDVKGMVGSHYREYFGMYDPDIVWIRNEERKTDYEITLDERSYGDLYSTDNMREEDTE